ncbi:Rieske 2Fe-2S domain-containing protein [Moorena producens]|uniref:Rieske 2Fe-2S domain-containing protein n=1 Tax=Moorena producens TaxID=1155739 RepID=UPI003C743A97
MIASRFPFTSFPSGWFRIAYSDELRPGQVKPLRYFSRDLVLFRTQQGQAHVLDAHCPHLGAHLGHGGKVKGETIQCPFHGWCLEGQGQCVDIPYASKIPPKARIRAWPVREVNGLIMMYYSRDQEQPTWEMPQLPEYNSEEWVMLKRISWRNIKTHVQEIGENGSDIAHLTCRHPQAVKDFERGTPPEINGPVFTYRTNPTYKNKFPIPMINPKLTVSHEFTCYGLGFLATRVRVNVLGGIWILFDLFPTPIDEEYIELQGIFGVKKIVNRVITRFIGSDPAREAEMAIYQDMPMWENKLYRSTPNLCEGDGPIREYRRWVRQFYSEQKNLAKVLVQQS